MVEPRLMRSEERGQHSHYIQLLKTEQGYGDFTDYDFLHKRVHNTLHGGSAFSVFDLI